MTNEPEPNTRAGEAFDPPCTDCGDTGVTFQTERACTCDAATRPLPQPSNTCEMPEVAAMRYIEQLRSNYGTVTILPDNEDAESRDMQMEVDCCGEWTNWSDQRFYGETVIQCLARAVVILEKWKDMNNVG